MKGLVTLKSSKKSLLPVKQMTNGLVKLTQADVNLLD